MKQTNLLNYLPGMSFSSYLERIEGISPKYFTTLQFDNKKVSKIIREMNKNSVDFEGAEKGGRGDSYRQSQTNITVRLTGILQIIEYITQVKDPHKLPDTFRILDVLGGDGTLIRAISSTYKGVKKTPPIILTSDIAGDMIASALEYGLPAIREPASHLFLKNNSFDGVVIAYGTHHIPRKELLRSCQEAYRVLKPKGKIVLHDFEEGSTQAKWFNDVVDKYSLTGHKYPHLTKKQIQTYLEKSGFRDIQIIHMYDPFITSDTSEEGAYMKLMSYVINMYGLEKLKNNGKITKLSHKRVHGLIKKNIIYDYSSIDAAQENWKVSVSFYKTGNVFFAEMPRLAIVGIGTK